MDFRRFFDAAIGPYIAVPRFMTDWVDRAFPYFATAMNFLWSGLLLMEILSRRETAVGNKFCALVAGYLSGAG